jgi:hypothetical protein
MTAREAQPRMTSDQPMGMCCPGCKQPPALSFATQAFCATEGCKVFAWNPESTLDEFLDTMEILDWKGLSSESSSGAEPAP